jgi:hypothetical protein
LPWIEPVFEIKVCESFQVVPFSLGSGIANTRKTPAVQSNPSALEKIAIPLSNEKGTI